MPDDCTWCGYGTPVSVPGSLITLGEFWCLTGTDFSVAGFEACYISPASDAVREYCGTDFGSQTIVREKQRSKLTLDQDLWVDFWIKPVTGVDRIALSWGSDTDNETELDLSCMDLFMPEGYALLPFVGVQACISRVNRANIGVGWMTTGDEYITVSDYYGGADVPDSVKKAVALLAWESYRVQADMISSGLMAGVVKSYSIGQYSQTSGSAYSGYVKLQGTLGWGTPLSEMAEKLLLPFIQAGSVGVLGN